MFSARTNWPKDLNRLAEVLEHRRARGLPLLDLTESNPTRAGFRYNQEAILAALANAGSMQYDPNPGGLLCAREAVARYYAASNLPVAPERIVLTTGTSEAYSQALRLVANPGDEILCPSPSYPLFDFLADLNDVKLVRYPLAYEPHWRIDLDQLRALLTHRSRAIIVVNPNNPTGSFLRDEELAMLTELARDKELTLIVDEVFRDYPWDVGTRGPEAGMRNRAASTVATDSCLTLTLNGLSKLSALPQMKLAWTVVSGPDEIVKEALRRLEIICDTYLSVGTPVQHAAHALLVQGQSVRGQILERIRHNLAAVDRLIRGTPVSRLTAEGGWYAILRLPNIRSDEEWAIELLSADGVYVHPGHFFGFRQEGHLVVSLLPEQRRFAAGIGKIVECVARSC